MTDNNNDGAYLEKGAKRIAVALDEERAGKLSHAIIHLSEGIEILLIGGKNDTNAQRKHHVFTRLMDYIHRLEDLHQRVKRQYLASIPQSSHSHRKNQMYSRSATTVEDELDEFDESVLDEVDSILGKKEIRHKPLNRSQTCPAPQRMHVNHPPQSKQPLHYQPPHPRQQYLPKQTTQQPHQHMPQHPQPHLQQQQKKKKEEEEEEIEEEEQKTNRATPIPSVTPLTPTAMNNLISKRPPSYYQDTLSFIQKCVFKI
eukprot:m.73931 g.73931  ORF g.73931 m.73931 type:complete len:257 (-) comp11788_c2_seq1:2553-3323(-)